LEVVQTLVSHNRKDKAHFRECRLSTEKRGTPPADNLYGVIVEKEGKKNLRREKKKIIDFTRKK
jgi:hypothetical protein